MAAITTNVLSALIGRQILGQAVSDASYSIYDSVGSIFNYNNNIDNTLRQLDIKEKVKSVDSLISQIGNCNNVIVELLTGLHEAIILIREDLKQLEFKVNEHKAKYFSTWRYLNCKNQLDSLILNSAILDKRFDYIIKAVLLIGYSETAYIKSNINYENKRLGKEVKFIKQD